jgi:nucleotide-binding universal stress UspA family protein
VLLAVAERYLTAHAGLGSLHADDDLVAGTETALAQAKDLVDADEAVLSSGRLVDLLCADCVRRGATLVAVGVRPHRRLSALTFGGHDVEALRDVRCALLLARPGWGPSKPDRILVGVDGSPEARAAEHAARALAARLDREVVPWSDSATSSTPRCYGRSARTRCSIQRRSRRPWPPHRRDVPSS